MAPAGPFLRGSGRFGACARALRDMAPDLLATQEATPDFLDILTGALPGHGVVGRGRRADGLGIQCAVLYRRDLFELEAEGHFWMSPTPRVPGSKFFGMGLCRVATWVVLRDRAERTFSLVNVHFSHLRRRCQARLLLRQLEPLPRPRVVAGDFNALPWPPTSCHHLLTGCLRDTAPWGPSTWPAPFPVARLDWILTSPQVRCRAHRAGPPTGSDHLPVIADLEFP